MWRANQSATSTLAKAQERRKRGYTTIRTYTRVYARQKGRNESFVAVVAPQVDHKRSLHAMPNI
jgi:hypothetical protein